MRSSIRRRSEVSIIGSLDPPTTEHFFVLALPLRIRVARIYIASIRFSAESGAKQTPSVPIGWPSLVQMDAVDNGDWFPWIGIRDRGQPRERRTGRLAEHCCIVHVCLGSRRASRERLNGQNLAAESGLCRQLYRFEPSIALFKKNEPKPQNAH